MSEAEKVEENYDERNDGVPGVESLALALYSSSLSIDFEEDKIFSDNPVSSEGLKLNGDFPIVPISTSLPRCRLTEPETIVDFASAVIGSSDLIDAACPCCQQALHDNNTTTLSWPADIARARGSILPIGSSDDDEADDVSQEDLPWSLGSSGTYCYQKRVLVEGWVHKKGTGQDWLGSRGWKPRWARLVTARVDGYDCDVPLLLMYWHPSSPVVCTAFVLDSAVVLAVDVGDKEQWNAFRFEIRHAANRENVTLLVNRTFSAPRKGRDAWVFAISEALLSYEKDKDQARKIAVWKETEATGRYIRPNIWKKTGRPNIPIFDEVWTGDGFVNVDVRRPTTPLAEETRRPIDLPTSPRHMKPARVGSPPTSPRPPPLSPQTSSGRVTSPLAVSKTERTATKM